jgi:CMP-N,N'-diacetyllegionaminic acid synthase
MQVRTTHRVLFLIPARGGSKGVPRKNLRAVGGIPLVARAIRTAQAANRALQGRHIVLVSTDDRRIADTAARWGAPPPFLRPENLATDESPSIDVVIHAVQQMRRLGEQVEAVVLLQPTSPLTSPDDVLAALALWSHEPDTPVVSVAEAEHPPQWSFELQDGRLVPLAPGWDAPQRQALAPTFRLNGAVCVAATEWLQRERTFLRPRVTRALVMPRERSLDVDSPLDLRYAEAALCALGGRDADFGSRRLGRAYPVALVQELALEAWRGLSSEAAASVARQLVAVGMDGVCVHAGRSWSAVEPACAVAAAMADAGCVAIVSVRDTAGPGRVEAPPTRGGVEVSLRQLLTQQVQGPAGTWVVDCAGEAIESIMRGADLMQDACPVWLNPEPLCGAARATMQPVGVRVPPLLVRALSAVAAGARLVVCESFDEALSAGQLPARRSELLGELARAVQEFQALGKAWVEESEACPTSY